MITNKEALLLIASAPKGKKRAELLKDDEIRRAVLSSGANVTIYTGEVNHNAQDVVQSLRDVYIGLIQRKNRYGNFDGLGALGGLAERTDRKFFDKMTLQEKLQLVSLKDDVIMAGNYPVITDDIDIIRKNNVLREMREELDNLGIDYIRINPEEMELISMPKVKDDNYMVNIWNGEGECYAITPYCHIYKDSTGIIDLISQNAKEQVGGEASEYRKVLLTDALGAYGNFNGKHRMEDGRNAVKDYRYPHEYLTAWVLASKLLGGNDEKMIQLAMAVQKKCNHIVSFDKIAEATSQTMKDVADVLNVGENTLKKMEECVGYVYKSKKNEQLIQQNYCPDR